MAADANTASFYRDMAESLASEYAGVPCDHVDRLEQSFQGCQTILDVGCGTGRDLACLLRKGKDAYGMDSSKEMLEAAKATLSGAGLSGIGRLFVAALPDLSRFADEEFDGVLCSAVFMHLRDEEVFDAVYAIRRILRPGGILVVSVPAVRNDVDPITRRDRHGRLFSDIPPEKLRLLFERIGFTVCELATVPDSLGRSDFSWNVTKFERLDDIGQRPLHLVESILNRDKTRFGICRSDMPEVVSSMYFSMTASIRAFAWIRTFGVSCA